MTETEKQAPYAHQEYPKMLFFGKIQPADKEQAEGSTMVVNSPEEEKAAKESGWKATKKDKPGVPVEVDAAEKELEATKKALAEATEKLAALEAEKKLESATEEAKEQAESKAKSATAGAKKAAE